ncbi:MAG: tetratricopeptide repeat protein [Planctomycetes bacterium]|nr:tetratricopeptide repeat protein [Planctomycetota bacterium]
MRASLALAAMMMILGGCVSELPVDSVRVNAYDAYRAGDVDTATTKFTECVDRDATDYKSHYYLGQLALRKLMDPGLAQRHLELALSLYESHLRHPWVMSAGAPETYVPAPTRQQITDALAEAIYQQRNQPQLMSFLRDVIDKYGESGDYLRQATYLVKAGDHDAAKQAYQNAIKVAPKTDTAPYLAFADFYDSINARDAALHELQIAYGIDPTTPGLADAIRAHGLVPGPTIALPPDPIE